MSNLTRMTPFGTQAPPPPTLQFHFTDEKDNPKLALELSRWITSWIDSGFSGYYGLRNNRFRQNRLWAQGLQDMTPFADMMQIDGNNAYINIDMTPPPVMKKYIEQVVDLFMDIKEKPNIHAEDTRSLAQKQKDQKEAKFRMQYAMQIMQLQQKTGVQLENPNAFTPQDNDQLELFFNLQYKLPEETIISSVLSKIIEENGLQEIKRKVIGDGTETGLMVMRTEKDENGHIKIKRIEPERFFYSYTEYQDFRDCAFVGEIMSMKVTDFRKKFAAGTFNVDPMDEKTIFDLVKRYGQKDSKDSMSWDDRYYSSFYRPYDDFTIPIVYFEIKTDGSFFTKEKTTRMGNKILDILDSKPTDTAPTTEVKERIYDNVYAGWVIKNSSVVLRWNKLRNSIRNPHNLSEEYFSYSAYMYDAYQMRNMALPERALTSVKQMIFAYLKIQQIIAKMRPPGSAIDYSMLLSVTDGSGRKLKPLDAKKFFEQTGDYFYSSLDETGQQTGRTPFMPLQNSEGATQIRELMEVYNFYLTRLQMDLGTNPSASAQPLQPRMGVEIVKEQIRIAESSIHNIYDGWICLYSEAVKKAGILAWDDIIFENSAYNSFLQGAKKINKEATFTYKIKMLPNDKEIAYIESIINTALQANEIDFEGAFRVRNIAKENISLAEMYLSRIKKQKMMEDMQRQRMAMLTNEEIQQHSVMLNAQGKEAVEMTKGKARIINTEAENEARKEQLLQQFVQQALMSSLKTGQPLDGYTKEIVEKYLNGNIQQLTHTGTNGEPVQQPQPQQSQPQQSPQAGANNMGQQNAQQPNMQENGNQNDTPREEPMRVRPDQPPMT